ncbi:hypothetical protein [Streptomyces filamentosus]|uniref:hypothetical protein n=1 Tax=Streptomyces filamentosus TaxID=67294 RepID=UPI0033EDAAE2
MTSDLSKAEYETAYALLSGLGPETTTSTSSSPDLDPTRSSLIVPDGYTVRETVETTPDGTTKVTREFVPLPFSAPPAGPERSVPTGSAARRTLPEWLSENRRKTKATVYLTAAAAVTTVGTAYGTDIAAGITAGADALWTATITVLKVTGIVVAAALVLRVAFGGRRRRPRTGTFEGSFKGVWRQD